MYIFCYRSSQKKTLLINFRLLVMTYEYYEIYCVEIKFYFAFNSFIHANYKIITDAREFLTPFERKNFFLIEIRLRILKNTSNLHATFISKNIKSVHCIWFGSLYRDVIWKRSDVFLKKISKHCLIHVLSDLNKIK